MKRIIFVSLVLLAFLLSGCTPEESTPEEIQPAAGLANPASVYCHGLGYVEETRENDEGSYGVCIFPDGTECDSWDFLAGRCGQENSYCTQQGFKITANDTNIGTCTFENGSSCSELEYFQGECAP